jgi:hypothetical protein
MGIKKHQIYLFIAVLLMILHTVSRGGNATNDAE